MLDAAETLADLRSPPGNRLERRRPRRSMQQPRERSVAYLLSLGCIGPGGCRDRWLPL